MSRGEQTIYDKILIKYDKNEQMHVVFFQERHFLEIKNVNAKNHTGWGGGWGGGHCGITHSPYSRPLLIVNALTHTPYSWQLLIGLLELFLINYCMFMNNLQPYIDTFIL